MELTPIEQLKRQVEKLKVLVIKVDPKPKKLVSAIDGLEILVNAVDFELAEKEDDIRVLIENVDRLEKTI